jgi:hypothetical protein
MKRTSSVSDLTDSHYQTRTDHPSVERNNGLGAEEETGLAHLLMNHTVDQILRLPDFIGLDDLLKAFIGKKALPDDPSSAVEFQRRILKLDEPKLILAMLKLGDPHLSIDSPEIARNVLNALRLDPKQLFPDVRLMVGLQVLSVADALLPLVTEIIRLKNGIAKVHIHFNHFENFALEPLFNALSIVDDLQLRFSGPAVMHPGALSILASLLSQNKKIHTLVLPNLPAYKGSDSMAHRLFPLLDALKNQTHIEECLLSKITEELQEPLGDFLGNSHSLKTFGISMQTTVSTPGLIEGLEKNRSLEYLRVDIDSITQGMLIEDSILPLISAIEENRTSVAHFELSMRRFPADMVSSQLDASQQGLKDGSIIGNLIAGNSTLHTLTLVFPAVVDFDLSPLGDGLKQNTSLETLYISFHGDWNGNGSKKNHIDRTTLAAFFEKLARNRTLTTMIIGDPANFGCSVLPDDEQEKLTNILARNSCLRHFFCSSAYIEGATSGFLQTLGLPADPAVVIAKHLMRQSPVIANRALALINKESNERALSWRSNQSIVDWKRALSVPQRDRQAARNVTANLLANIATTAADFSEDDIRFFAGIEQVDEILFEWMTTKPDFYLSLAKRFCEAVGAVPMRKRIIDVLNEQGDSLTIRHLSALEKSFEPDQQHLAGLMDLDLNYHAIDSTEVKLFAGYNVHTFKNFYYALSDWCVENQLPELYLACAENYPDQNARIRRMPSDVLQRVVSKIHLFKKLIRLDIDGMTPDTVAEITTPLLSSTPGLQYLDLQNVQCTKQVFTMMMYKLSENRSMKAFTLNFHRAQEAFPWFETIVATLEANPVLRLLNLCLPPGFDHPEMDKLGRLAMSHPRFELDFTGGASDEED